MLPFLVRLYDRKHGYTCLSIRASEHGCPTNGGAGENSMLGLNGILRHTFEPLGPLTIPFELIIPHCRPFFVLWQIAFLVWRSDMLRKDVSIQAFSAEYRDECKSGCARYILHDTPHWRRKVERLCLSFRSILTEKPNFAPKIIAGPIYIYIILRTNWSPSSSIVWRVGGRRQLGVRRRLGKGLHLLGGWWYHRLCFGEQGCNFGKMPAV